MPGRPPSQFEVNLNAIDDSLSSSKFRSIISNNISKSKLEEFSRKLNQLLFETAARDAAPRDHELQGGVEPGDDGDLAPRDLGPQDLAAQDPPTPSPATTPEATETGSNNTSSDQNSSTQSKGLAEQVVEILDNTEDCIDEKILIVNKLFHGLESEHTGCFFFLWIQSGGCKSAILRSFQQFLYFLHSKIWAHFHFGTFDQ